MVAGLQEKWECELDSDLWFRGESARHENTSLVPKVYRPSRPVDELLETEYRIWQDFVRCGEQLCEVIPEDDFEWYFLIGADGDAEAHIRRWCAEWKRVKAGSCPRPATAGVRIISTSRMGDWEVFDPRNYPHAEQSCSAAEGDISRRGRELPTG